MGKEKTTNPEAEVEMGDFGPIYRQFEGKPQKAIELLRKMQTGECVNALHRDDIGNIGLIDILGGKIFWKARKYLSLRRFSLIW